MAHLAPGEYTGGNVINHFFLATWRRALFASVAIRSATRPVSPDVASIAPGVFTGG
ncbi:MAG: hypothetical protein WD875_08670 [Pirellulales bacterium]